MAADKRTLFRDDESGPNRRTRVLRNKEDHRRVRSAELVFEDGSMLLQIVVQTGYDWMHLYFDDEYSLVNMTHGIGDTEQATFERAKKALAARGWDV
jgi:hypothetical protein